jgi:hypothetical protein
MKKTGLLTKTKVELLKVAHRLGLRGISTLSKPELVSRIKRAQQARSIKTIRQLPGVAVGAHRLANELKRRAVRKRAKAAASRAAAKPVEPARRIKGSRQPKAVVMPVAEREPMVTSAAAKEMVAHKFDVAPKPVAQKQVFIEENLGDLPEAYGTGRLFLVARDPHWLYAYWDLSWQQMADARGQAVDGRLVLRVFEKNHAQPIQELMLHHESRNWYIHVGKAATTYSAQLGYWRHGGGFHVIGQSRDTTTPSDAVSPDTTARFVTIPLEFSFRDLMNLIRGHMRDGERLADALHRLELAGFPFPFKVEVALGPWTAEQAEALERLLGGDLWRRIRMGSFEISEWLRRRLQEQLGSAIFSGFSPAGASWSAAVDGRLADELRLERKTATKGHVGKVRRPARSKASRRV